MNQNGEHAAELCIAELKDRGCDFSLLFWLRNPEMLAGSPFGNDMIVFMEKDMKIDISQFDDGLFRGGFFQALRKEFNKSGLNPDSPQNYVEACGEGGKESALNKWRQERWPRPHQTFCFQTRAVTNSAFFIFQCWQAKIDCRVKRGLNHVNRFNRFVNRFFSRIGWSSYDAAVAQGAGGSSASRRTRAARSAI